MRFTGREDVALPIERAFDEISTFRFIERLAQQHGVEVERLDSRAQPDAGMGWRLRFTYRGRERLLTARLTRVERPELMEFEGRMATLESRAVLDLIPLSPQRTRLAVSLEVTPRGVLSRLLMPAVWLGRGRLEARFRSRVSDYARMVERRAGGAPA